MFDFSFHTQSNSGEIFKGLKVLFKTFFSRIFSYFIKLKHNIYIANTNEVLIKNLKI